MKIGFFEEEVNVKSMIRLITYSCFLVAAIIAFVTMWYAVTNPEPRSIVIDGGAMLVGTFLVSGVGGKVWQRFGEKESTTEKT